MTYAELREEIDREIEAKWLVQYADPEDRRRLAIDIALAEQLRNEAERLANEGLLADAERRLECFLWPKWPSLDDCETAYEEAMNR